MNKQLFISESRGDSNQCTPCREKLDTQDMNTSRISPHTTHVYFLWTVHLRGNLSLAITSVGRILLLPRKKALDTTPSPTEWSTDGPHSFSPNTTIEAVMKVKYLLVNKLYRFTRRITPACDRYVQYLLVGANPSVLNRHGRRLQSWRCRLSTYHSLTFPTDGLYFSPKGPARSPV
jgi:hypothetical protein